MLCLQQYWSSDFARTKYLALLYGVELQVKLFKPSSAWAKLAKISPALIYESKADRSDVFSVNDDIINSPFFNILI